MNADYFIDLVTALWLGFTGACIGSFLNVVAYRLPRGLSVVWRPSHCPHCGHPIRPRDNVPVIGWLVLRGKCRDCGAPIAARYAIVESILGGVFFVLTYVELFTGGSNLPGGPYSQFTGAMNLVWHPDWPIIGLYVYHCAAATILFTMALLDRDDQQIPKGLLLLAGIVGILPSVLLGAPFIFPPPAGVGAYLLLILAHVIFAILLCLMLKVSAGTHPEKVFNLVVALSVAGLFLGTGTLYRAAYFGVFLVLLVIATLSRASAPRLSMTNLDGVWLALVALLVGGTMVWA